jgi:hypothetical protein
MVTGYPVSNLLALIVVHVDVLLIALAWLSQLYSQFPEVPIVKVDDMGNVVSINGSFDPYDDPEDPLIRGAPNRQGDNDEWPEVAGEIGGMDDPLDAPWRK